MDRHLAHDAARFAGISIGIVNPAIVGIFSAGQHPGRKTSASSLLVTQTSSRACRSRLSAAAVRPLPPGYEEHQAALLAARRLYLAIWHLASGLPDERHLGQLRVFTGN
jgi:hypothetical protein